MITLNKYVPNLTAKLWFRWSSSNFPNQNLLRAWFHY